MEKRFYNSYWEYANEFSALYGMKLTENDQRDIISFTPYIYNTCSANCKFCSEKLVRDGSVMVCNNSRHHYDEELNQTIMCFRKGVEVRRNEVYRDIINKMADVVDFRLVCVLQKCGVGTLDEIDRYLDFAKSLGVKDVVFRELAMFDDSIENGVTSNYIEENRVEIMDLITRLNPNDFRLTDIIKGYYYFSFGYRFRNGLNVCFEMSDYEEMIAKHYGDKIHKLILIEPKKLCV